MPVQTPIKARTHPSSDHQMHTYRTFLVMLLCVFGFFFTTKFWVPDTSNITSTAFGTSIHTSDSISLVLEDWRYNPDSNYMEAVFQVVQNGYLYSSSLQFRTELYSDNSQTTPLSCAVVYSDDDTLIVQMHDLPKGWKILSLRIGDNISSLKSAETGDLTSSAANVLDASQDDTPAHFNADVRTVQMDTTLAPKTEMEYAVEAISRNIASQNEQIETYQKQISQNTQTIKGLQNDIASIQKEQAYQTSSELQGSNASIQNKQTQIQSLEDKNESFEEDIEACQGKIDKLKLKLHDLQTGTTRTYEEGNEAVAGASSAPSASVSSSTPAVSSSPSASSETPVSSMPASQAPISSMPAASSAPQSGITYTPIS